MLLGFSFVIIFVLVLGVYNFYATNEVNHKTESIIDTEVPVLLSNQQLAYTIAHRISIIRSFLGTGDEDHMKEFDEYTKMGHDYANRIKNALPTKEYDESTYTALKKWEAAIEEDVFGVYQERQRAQARSNFNSLLKDAEKMMNEYEAFAFDRESLIQESGQEVITSGRTTIYVASAIVAAVILVGVVIALGTSRTITNPLRTVMERMNSIAEGNLTHEPLETNLRDEIGQLVDATNEMTENSRNLLDSIHKASENINDESEALTSSADEVKAGSEQVASTMEDLASGSETQARHAGELSSVMSQFIQRVEQANENGEYIQTASEDVLKMTNEGTALMDQSNKQMTLIDEIVQDAVAKVEGLDDHSKEISELVLVIQDIADQTNLLALNAAIEAARAGEHGRGFAVVADEVRKLAEQVSLSVTDITGIVNNIQNESSTVSKSLRAGYGEVTEGTTQIQTTRETFQHISTAVEEMVKHIHVVSENLEDIASNTQEMGGSIEEIAAVSEESAAGIEQTSAQSQQASSAMEEVAGSSRDLVELAENLDQYVRKFKV